MTKALWQNGKRTITGWWSYHWATDTFNIVLNNVDRVTGFQKMFTVHGETPEWGNWKLVDK